MGNKKGFKNSHTIFILILMCIIIFIACGSKNYINKEKTTATRAKITEQENKIQNSKQNENNKQDKNEEKKTNNDDSKEVSVYIRVEGYDHTVIPRTKVITGIYDLNPYSGPASGSSATASAGWDETKFTEPTVAHALVKLLLENNYTQGEGYDLQDYGWSLYIAMIDGDREFDYRSTSGWMYRVNDILPSIGCQGQPIKGEEEIVWYFGAYGFDTLFTKMKVDKTEVKVGEDISLSLNGIRNDIETWEQYEEPAVGASIYVNDKEYLIDDNKVITDENGQAVLKFNEPGEYTISAERFNKRKNIRDLVRPMPVTITVTDE